MNNDPEIKKEIWDARVKIVIGKFIITAVQVAFVLMIVILLLEYKVFGGGDATVKPLVLYFGLPIVAIVLLIGYQTSYKPKKAKIDIFTKYLMDYYQGVHSEQVPNNAIVARSFSTDVSLPLWDNIDYLCFKKDEFICLFPCKAPIECIDTYRNNQIAFTTIKVKESIIRYSTSAKVSRQTYTYDAKKNLQTTTTTYDTLSLNIGDKTIIIQSSIFSLLNPTATAEKPVAQKEVKMANPGEDIEKRIEKLSRLHDQKLITDEEFSEQKKKLLDQI